jgi:hypothetical protein
MWTEVQINFCSENTDFVPKGLQDSARVSTPGADKKGTALKVAVEMRFPPWMPNEILNQFLPPLQGGALLSMCPGVETPGSVL